MNDVCRCGDYATCQLQVVTTANGQRCVNCGKPRQAERPKLEEYSYYGGQVGLNDRPAHKP